MRKTILPLALSIFIVTAFFLSIQAKKNPVQAQCEGTGCSIFTCGWDPGRGGSPCIFAGGCCTPQGACIDGTPSGGPTPPPQSWCQQPSPPETPTLPVGPPTAPPTSAPTSPPATPTPGTSCQIGNSSVCPAGNTCRCGYAGQDYTSCTQGNCWPIVNSTACGPNPGPNCAGNEDCSRLCGGTTAECRTGRCWDDGAVDNRPACSAQGGTCMDNCTNNPPVCHGERPARDCGTQICCVQFACPTATPVPNDGGGSGDDVGYDVQCDGTGVSTAFGCITNTFTNLVDTLIKLGTGIGGGIAYLLILLAGFQIITSSGNPERLEAGRELMTSAVSGLLLIIFSIFILRFLGVSVLGIPGFQ